MSRRRLQILAGLALAALFVWLFLRQADLGEVRRVLSRADLPLVALAATLTLFTSVQRAWRWQLLLRPLARVPVWPLIDAIFIGWAVTLVLPGRLGEIARPVYLSRRVGIRATPAIGTVVLERIFDAAAVLTLMALYLTFLPAPPVLDDQGRVAMDAMRSSGTLALLAVLVGGAVAMFTLRSRVARERIESSIRHWLPGRVAELGVAFLEGLSGLGSPWLVLRIAVSSLVLWCTILLSYVLLLRALDIDLPWYASIPIVVLLVIGVMVPTPGAVGSFHKAAQIGLVSLWNVDNEVAVAWAILSHLAAFGVLGLVGLLVALKEGFRPGDVQQLRADGAGEADDRAL